MSGRPTRSASIPIPAARNIENVISMPFMTNPGSVGNTRPRLTAVPRSQFHASPERVTNPRGNVASSPVRTMSGSYSTAVARPSVGTNPSPPVFEPRIIRATTYPARPTDPACYPTSTSPASVRTRRPSAARTASTTTTVSATGIRTSVVSSTVAPSAPSEKQLTPQTFPRPTYLENSALRSLLYTDPPPVQSQHRDTDHHHGHFHFTGYKEATAPIPMPSTMSYPYMRRELSPGIDSDEDSYASPPPPNPSAPAASTAGTLMANPVLRLPTRWSEVERHQSLSCSSDGRDLTFVGPSFNGDKESAAARSNYPIPPACGIYYYEVEILQKGSKGHISIGLAAGDVRLSRLPGWEKHSFGYHADDGWSFSGLKDGSPYGPTFDSGDIIGCGIDFSQHRAFYTKNGAMLGMVFESVGKDYEIYPSIGLRHASESVRVNFGHAPFRFSIEDHVLTRRNEVWDNVQTTPINWNLLRGGRKTEQEVDMTKKEEGVNDGVEDEAAKLPLRRLVLSYLAHHGYTKTAQAFRSQCEVSGSSSGRSLTVNEEHDMDTDEAAPSTSETTESEDDRELRTRVDIVNSVLNGDIDTALSQTQELYPTVLEREQGLMSFKLRCRKFVELILEASEALKQVKPETPTERGRDAKREVDKEAEMDEMDEPGAMDVDDPSPEAHAHSSESTYTDPQTTTTTSVERTRSPSSSSSQSSTASGPAAIAKAALHTALAYGQTLESDYKHDVRPEVRSHLKRTFGVVAYTDPLAVGGEVAEMAGQEARARLAIEMNQAILESQGKPTHPPLEMVYRQTAACIVQLGLLGEGAAAFADMSKEFLEG